jgi:predicted negative regulator of RcsB-dependent stress response
MKSERRHDLQSNELANTLGSGIEKVQPFVQYIVGGVVIAALLAIGWGVYTSFARKSAAAAWTEYYFTLNTSDAESFKAIAVDHPGSAAAIWAEQTAGDEYLADGIDALYKDRGQGVELLKKAIACYETVNSKAQNGELRTRAVLGLAQAHESLGEIDKAKQHYQQVIVAGLQPAITTVATNRLAFLNSQAGKDFYEWFNKLKPTLALPPRMPGDLSVPPTSPNLKFDTPVDTSGISLPQAPTAPTSTTPAAPPRGADGKAIELPTVEPAAPAAAAPTDPATPTPPVAPTVDAPATPAPEPAPETATPAVDGPAEPK